MISSRTVPEWGGPRGRVQFEFTLLGFIFFKEGGEQFVNSSRAARTVREQFENSSRVQFVISSRTVPEWGMNKKGEGLEFEFSSSSRCLGSFFFKEGGGNSS